jgi:outer membrane protein assembly factor BamB
MEKGASYSGASIYAEGVLYISIGDEIVCFDPQTQEIIWKTSLPGYFSRKFALQGNVLLVTDKEHINALSKDTGKIIWQQGELTDPVNPIIIGNTVYVMEGFSREIFAFDLQTGKYEGKLHSSLPELLRTDRDELISDGNILLFSMQNFLYAYDQ